MKPPIRLQWVAIVMALTIIISTAIAQSDGTTSLRITHAWARPGETMSAAYLHIHNEGLADDQLVAVHSGIGIAEIHQTQMQNDIMQMRQVNAINIPAQDVVRLEPAGYHIMLMGLTEPLIEGSNITLVLTFSSGAEINVLVSVSQTPIPHEIEPDEMTERALAAIQHDLYVGQVVNPPVQVQDFVAPASDESLARLSDTNGTWRVIFFGYMHCPDFCPLTLVDYRDTRALLGDAMDDVTFMMISVDSVRDRPHIMRQYLDNFDPAFIGFSPDDLTLKRIQPDYDFYYQRRMDEGTQAIYTVDHSTRSYLLDRDGVLRASFAYDTPPRQMAVALRWYIEHE